MTALRQSLAIVAAALTLAAPARALAQAADPAVVLNPGDAVRITVWRSAELSGDFDIASDSTIAHPMYRDVKAGGMPFNLVQDRIRETLQKFSSTPQFVAQPLLRIAVGGQVRTPGLQTLPPEVTIAQAIAGAGGATDRARLDRVHLVRNGQESTLNLLAPGGGGERHVRSGDQIFVETRTSVFRDYIAPAAGLIAAAAAVLNIVLKN